MAKQIDAEKLVFGLDIGTRSIVGTVGYRVRNKFVVVTQKVKEHESRAMLDGQIHDIGRVAQTIHDVKTQCEEAIGSELKQVCIAAAGRVLRTLDTHVDMVLEENREITSEDIANLISLGIEKAYREFTDAENPDLKFYCVGYSVVRYYLNGVVMGNLEGHKATKISADLIATFLPDDVVDGLYKSVELAGLEVANLTLEPIAAISVAIPEKFRMLNIALVDVGAGTSDISITRDGSIIAYGMIPMAGDAITEKIAMHCLVDFDMAEKIKRASDTQETIEYEDIMGLPQTITKAEVLDLLKDVIEEEAVKVADEIKRLNGDKAVSAVFVVGGGGIITGYTEKLAENLGLVRERVALRGKEVMGNIEFLEENALKTSLMVTPIGICMNYYEHNNNLVYVTFNGERMKMYDNGHVTIVDVAIQAAFPNDGLFPKRGKALIYSVNGKSKIQKGELGEAAEITLNGKTADLNEPVKMNDKIVIRESTAGVRARLRISNLPEFKDGSKLSVDGKDIELTRPVYANGVLVTPDYEIREDDRIEIKDACTMEQLLGSMEEEKTPEEDYVTKDEAEETSPVAEKEDLLEEETPGETEETIAELETRETAENAGKPLGDTDTLKETAPGPKEPQPKAEAASNEGPVSITVMVNRAPVVLTGKREYVYVDVFNFINFDLSSPRGSGIVTLHNGAPAGYMNPLHDGDVLEIFWKD